MRRVGSRVWERRGGVVASNKEACQEQNGIVDLDVAIIVGIGCLHAGNAFSAWLRSEQPTQDGNRVTEGRRCPESLTGESRSVFRRIVPEDRAANVPPDELGAKDPEVPGQQLESLVPVPRSAALTKAAHE